jgi:quinol monooxygenase YgiN
VVSYIDVSKPGVTRVTDILRQMAQASHQASAAAIYDVLQRLAPQNQFVIVQVWKNQQARIEHLAQPRVRALRAELDPFLVAPVDERLYAIIIASERSPVTPDAVYAVAHIDILGPNPVGRDAFLPTLKAFSDESRRAPGNLGYNAGCILSASCMHLRKEQGCQAKPDKPSSTHHFSPNSHAMR